MALCGLTEYCGSGTLQNDMIRDRIVVGICDVKLSKKLQPDAKLTLDKVVTQVCEVETVKQQQPQLKKDVKYYHMSQLELFKRNLDNKFWVSDKSKCKHSVTRHTPPSSSKDCSRCGKTPTHHFQYCPAKTAVCCKCNNCGYFQVVCWSKKPNKVQKIVKKNDKDYILLITKSKAKASEVLDNYFITPWYISWFSNWHRSWHNSHNTSYPHPLWQKSHKMFWQKCSNGKSGHIYILDSNLTTTIKTWS